MTLEEKTDSAGTGMQQNGNGLYLPSLVIENFRGFRKLEIPELGQVTLLVGENGSGKSTVLEAVHLYASAGSIGTMRRILGARENILEKAGMDGDDSSTGLGRGGSIRERGDLDLDFGGLFSRFGESEAANVARIGPAGNAGTLAISLDNVEPAQLEGAHPSLSGENDFKCLRVSFGCEELGRLPVSGGRMFAPRGAAGSFGWDAEKARSFRIDSVLLGPGLPSNAEIVRRYEDLLMTAGAKQVSEVMRAVNGDIGELASRGDGRMGHTRRCMMVKRRGVEGQVPLGSMGEGMVRLFGMAVTLIGAKRGMLLLDGMDRCIHHSLFEQVWDFVFRTAMGSNVQVIATTHSRDCVRGFAQVSRDHSERIRSALTRIDREGDHAWAVPYSVEGLLAAVRAGIEVR